MALRAQNNLNPAALVEASRAAAELTVEAGRLRGQGIAALGAGLERGVTARTEDRKYEQHRQDVLTQQNIENQRAEQSRLDSMGLQQFHADLATVKLADENISQAMEDREAALTGGDQERAQWAQGRIEQWSKTKEAKSASVANFKVRAQPSCPG